MSLDECGESKKAVAEAYFSGQIDRDEAVAELGDDAVNDLDYAREAVDADILWGLERP